MWREISTSVANQSMKSALDWQREGVVVDSRSGDQTRVDSGLVEGPLWFNKWRNEDGGDGFGDSWGGVGLRVGVTA